MKEVTSGLYRGPRPQTNDEFVAIQAQTFINLEDGWFESLRDLRGQEELWGFEMNRDVVHLPMSDFFPPSKKSVQTFLEVLARAMKRGPVYVHCLHGKDRTGFMIAQFRIRAQGWTKEKAVNEMFENGFHKWPYYFWTIFI